MQEKNEVYQIKIEGIVKLNWLAISEEITVEHTDDGKTNLTAVLPDQTALHGILIRIRDFGLSLVEVKRIDNLD